jgi:hypothetical protein
VAPEKLVWAVGALAEGLGIRAVARVFEVDPNTVLQWAVYLSPADNCEGLLPCRLPEVNQPVISTANGFSTRRSTLLACM